MNSLRNLPRPTEAQRRLLGDLADGGWVVARRKLLGTWRYSPQTLRECLEARWVEVQPDEDEDRWRITRLGLITLGLPVDE